jgi:hypothetical protein
MIRTVVLAATCVATVWLVGISNATAGPRRMARVAVVYVRPVQDCSAFYEDYTRGFGWGSGPGQGLGFGTFEGALPRYPKNSFPNWYGDCLNWGHYSATGSARW